MTRVDLVDYAVTRKIVLLILQNWRQIRIRVIYGWGGLLRGEESAPAHSCMMMVHVMVAGHKRHLGVLGANYALVARLYIFINQSIKKASYRRADLIRIKP